MCPHCGWQYDPAEWSKKLKPGTESPHELVPYHDECPPFRAVCPGSKQHPRNPEADARPLWNGHPSPLVGEKKS